MCVYCVSVLLCCSYYSLLMSQLEYKKDQRLNLSILMNTESLEK